MSNSTRTYHKLNQIMPSHRNSLHYIEYAAVHSFDDTLTFQVAEKGRSKEISIPHRNIAGLLLGPGTSITHKAAQKLRDANICAMFVTGDGGSPLLWTAPDEYRPSEYCRAFLTIYYDEKRRDQAAKIFMSKRIEMVKKYWRKVITDISIIADLDQLCDDYLKSMSDKSGQALLLEEGRYTKQLSKLAARAYNVSWNSRQHHGQIDDTNAKLNHGNYLAYGVSNIAISVLGIPYSLSLIHGSTRKGALVFDVADIFKDAIILPAAFKAAAEGMSEKAFRSDILARIDSYGILSTCLNTIKDAALLAEIPLDTQEIPF